MDVSRVLRYFALLFLVIFTGKFVRAYSESQNVDEWTCYVQDNLNAMAIDKAAWKQWPRFFEM